MTPGLRLLERLCYDIMQVLEGTVRRNEIGALLEAAAWLAVAMLLVDFAIRLLFVGCEPPE